MAPFQKLGKIMKGGAEKPSSSKDSGSQSTDRMRKIKDAIITLPLMTASGIAMIPEDPTLYLMNT
uniref:Uncharacterized protein n=1 Tax=Setaria digitata TaxID=48799 RepID=A0A915Q6V2_9BILA